MGSMLRAFYFSVAVFAVLFSIVTLVATPAQAQTVRVMVAMDQADEASELLTIATANSPLPRLLNQPATVLPQRDLRDAMRATRTRENDVIIAPAHVTASALAHGYELVAAAGTEEKYVLVAPLNIASIAELKGKRAYFPNEDSLRSYVGRGLLTQSGLSVRALKQITYLQTSLGGLMSIGGRFDTTVALESEWKKWVAANPKSSQILAVSRPLPVGFGVVVRRDAPAALKRAVVQWVTTTDNVVPGVERFRATSDTQPYDYVASLGIFTPTSLTGVELVTARQAFELSQKGARLIDVRTEREFGTRHARGAISIPYDEKSLKEPEFDATVDSFKGLSRFSKDERLVFLCNGPECWKSFKASKVARAMGYTHVYWLRGGMPEWSSQALPTQNPL